MTILIFFCDITCKKPIINAPKVACIVLVRFASFSYPKERYRVVGKGWKKGKLVSHEEESLRKAIMVVRVASLCLAL